MAKSVGNVARVADLLEAGVPPRALRYALIAVPYRTNLAYSDETLQAAAAAIERIDAAVRGAARVSPGRAGRRRPSGSARRGSVRVRGRPRRRPEHCRRAGGGVRRGSRPEPAHRSRARSPPPTPNGPSPSCATSIACWRSGPTRKSRSCRPSWPSSSPSAKPRGPRVTGPNRTGCVTCSRIAASVVEDTRDGQRWKRIAEVARSS